MCTKLIVCIVVYAEQNSGTCVKQGCHARRLRAPAKERTSEVARQCHVAGSRTALMGCLDVKGKIRPAPCAARLGWAGTAAGGVCLTEPGCGPTQRCLRRRSAQMRKRGSAKAQLPGVCSTLLSTASTLRCVLRMCSSSSAQAVSASRRRVASMSFRCSLALCLKVLRKRAE